MAHARALLLVGRSGSGKTSSFCTTQASGCTPNDRSCPAAFPMGATAKYCCGDTGNFGSNDCPEGERHCGLLCQKTSQPCCPAGASDADCPSMTWDPSGCTQAKAPVGCGVCLSSKTCVACQAGNCCSGDVCGDHACVAGSACTGASSTGGTSTCPGVCSSDSDCSAFGARHCTNGSAGARCGSDGQCKCCLAMCDVNPSTEQSSNCQCMGCSSCSGDKQCQGGTCVFKAGGAPCD